MSAWGYYVGTWRAYATFSGRACRREFWSAFLIHVAIFMGLLFLSVAHPIFGALRLAFQLASLLPMLALFVRRCHDIDHSWWFLLFGLFPGFGLVIVLFAMCRSGQRGVNRYGEDPQRINEYGIQEK